VRYNSSGSPDQTFGSSGRVTTPLGANDFAALVIQPDGRIIVAGHTGGLTSDFAVFRYTSNGSLDPTFGPGGGGRVITDLGGEDIPRDVALQSDGKIVVAGEGIGGASSDFAVVRYNSNGSVDLSFGSAGRVGTNFFGGDDFAASVAIQPDGKIIVAGGACDARCMIAFARYHRNGLQDETFGVDGLVTADLSLLAHAASSVALQSDGKILIAGGGNEDEIRLLRYFPDGRPDTSFGFQGAIIDTFRSAAAMVVQPDGKIVVANTSGNLTLARYQSNGLVDPTFGSGGRAPIALSGVGGHAALTLQPDGKIVAGMTLPTSVNTDFALVRYTGPIVPLSLKFEPTTVRVGGAFSGIFAGANANTDSYFDVRFRMPGSSVDLEAFNWQFGSVEAHPVLQGTPTGIWTVTGVRPHQNLSDHFGDYTNVSVILNVIP
jgi:uncharacterized delta-60 repeat protein